MIFSLSCVVAQDSVNTNDTFQNIDDMAVTEEIDNSKDYYIGLSENDNSSINSNIITDDISSSDEPSSKNTLSSDSSSEKQTQGSAVSVSKISTEYPADYICFPGTFNVLTVTINSDVEDNFTIKLLADNQVVDSLDVQLTAGNQKFKLNDPTIRPIDETTVRGADNKKVNYTVQIYQMDTLITQNSIIADVMYNGYLGKDYAYPKSESWDWSYSTSVKGDVVFYSFNSNTYSGASTGSRSESFNLRLSGGKITESYLYILYNWDHTPDDLNNRFPLLDVSFNNVDISDRLLWSSLDLANMGSTWGALKYGLLGYNITDLTRPDKQNTIVVNRGCSTALYSSSVVTLYEKPGASYKNVYFGNGMDLLYNDYNDGNRPIKADSKVDISMDKVTEAMWYVFAGSAHSRDANLVFNNHTFENVYDGNSETMDMYQANVTSIIKESNNISFVATTTTVVAFHQLLVTTLEDTKVTVSKIATEYSNTAYAGTNNVITASINANYDGNYIVKLLADGNIVSTQTMKLKDSLNEISLIDPTVRVIDESTVAGAINNHVTYTVEVYDENVLLAKSNITVPIRYNGYLNKDFAYPTDDLEFNLNTTVTGNVLIDVLGADAYFGSDELAANKSYEFTLNLPKNSVFVNGLLYISYNYDKTPAGFPVFNMTFNNVDISNRIVGKYRDKTNLGSYGLSWYGVIIYDVSDLIKDGSNSLDLIKVNGTYAALYPPALIGLYNESDGNLKNIYIKNGADILSKTSYNKADRSVNITDNINVNIDKLKSATWYVFAANAKDNLADLTFNDNVYSNVWSGDNAHSLQYFTSDVTSLIKDSNTVGFISTGGGVLALQQILVVEKAKPEIIKPKVVLTANNVGMLYTSNQYYSVKVTQEGKALAGKAVKFTVNGKVVSANTDKNGVAKVKLSLNPGKYTVSASYDGIKVTNSVKVNSIIKASDKKVKKSAKKLVIKVSLKKVDGKYLKGKTLKLKINGKTLKAKTNKKGVATFTIKKNILKKLKAGKKYTYKVTYSKDTVSKKLTVKK
jgi:hypothetical protein